MHFLRRVAVWYVIYMYMWNERAILPLFPGRRPSQRFWPVNAMRIMRKLYHLYHSAQIILKSNRSHHLSFYVV